MSTDGTSFDIDIDVKGGSASESAAASVAKLADRLTASGQAATQAAAAVAAGEAAYKRAEAAAAGASAALEKIGLAASAQQGKATAIAAEYGLFSPQFQKASDKLAELTQRQTEAAAKATSTSAAMNAEAASLDKLKAASGAAEAAEKNLSKQHEAAKKSLASSEKATKDAADAQTKSVGAAGMLEGAFSKLGGPLGEAGQKASGFAGAVLKMGKSLGSAGPYVAAAVAIFAIATAALAATIAVTSWAVSLADAARTQSLLVAGIAKSVKGGAELEGMIDNISNRIPLTTDELLGLSKPLIDAGLKGQALADGLETAAAKAAKVKFGPDFAKQMNSLPSLTARLQSNFSKIFSGLNIEKLLEGLGSMVALFDKNSASANAIKAIFESFFQPLVDGIASVIPKMVAMFIQFEILVLKAMIAIKPWGSAIAAIGIGFLVIAAIVVAAVVIVIAILAAVAVATAAVVYAFYYLATAAPAAGAAIRDGIGAALDWLKGKFDEVVAFLQGLSFAEIGSNLIDGLVNGITTAGPKILTAITGLANGAITAAKKALGIASPSKIFAEIGMHTAAGMEQGVDGGADAVQGSIESLVAAPTAPTPTSAAAPGGGAKGASQGSSGGRPVTINVVSQADAINLRDLLAELGMQAGLGAPSAA